MSTTGTSNSAPGTGNHADNPADNPAAPSAAGRSTGTGDPGSNPGPGSNSAAIETPPEDRGRLLGCLSSLIIWPALIILAYFASDIIAKGQTLNALTPIPIFGYALWAAILWLIWYLVLSPILQFASLKRAAHTNPLKQTRRALKKLQRYKTEAENHPLRQSYWNLYNTLESRLPEPEKRRQLLQHLSTYREQSGINRKARQHILLYSRLAALGVVFSRNSLIDGLILLLLQMRLIISLATLYGYKPSPIFNSLCFGWVAGNSLIIALLGQGSAAQVGNALGSEFADCIAELMTGEDEALLLSADAAGTKFMQSTISALLEAVMSATAVYVTGHIFLRLLEREGERINLANLIRLRREGRLAIGKDILLKVPAEVVKRAAGRVISSALFLDPGN